MTPSYNQGLFIEETIRSVLLQGYPNLQYIVMDGGSTDNTLSILRKYEHAIDFWASERDQGQAAAINKGFARANGDILAWLNSDDTYELGVLSAVAKTFQQHPDADVVSGRCRQWYGNNSDQLIGPSPLRCFDDFLRIRSNWLNGRLIVQPEAFFRRRAFEKIGSLREELYYCFDACMWMDMAKRGCVFHSVDQHWANLRRHDGQKISNLVATRQELARVVRDQLRKNWDSVENPPVVLEELLCVLDDLLFVLDDLLGSERKVSRALRESRSYRVGRLLAKMKLW